ncbi:MAG: hypothetical protein ACI4B8_07980 [Candidatus Gastranaerophilaceae bacterium]
MEQNYWNRTFDKNKKYIWISERGKTTCEKCQSLNGKIFSGDKVPNRPHPNCKCEVEEYHGTTIQNVPQETHDNPKRVQKLEKQANDLEKQVIILRGEIQKANRIEAVYNYKKMYEQKIKELADVKKLIKEMGQNAKTKMDNLKSEIYQCAEDNKSSVKKSLNVLAKMKYIPPFSILPPVSKSTALVYGYFHSKKYNQKEAYNFFNLSAQTIGGFLYLKKEKVKSTNVKYLKNEEIKDKILKRMKEEMPTLKNCQVYEFNENSSIATKILNSYSLKEFFRKNKNDIRLFNTTNNDKIEFSSIDSDLYATIHGAQITNIKVDKNRNYINCQIEDFYNFNSDRLSYKGMLGSYLQDTNQIQPFYVIIHLKIPKSVWLKDD